MDVMKSHELIEEDYKLITKHLTQIKIGDKREAINMIKKKYQSKQTKSSDTDDGVLQNKT